MSKRFIHVNKKQRKDVLSWKLPQVIGSGTYQNSSQTLCPYKDPAEKNATQILEEINNPSTEIVTITISTASKRNLRFAIKVYMQPNFQIKLNELYNLPTPDELELLSPPSPIFYYFEFEKDQNSALIQLNSNDNVCMALSVQDASCPVLDLNQNVEYKGVYQTIRKQGGMRLTKTMSKQETKGVYIVLLVKDTDVECHVHRNLDFSKTKELNKIENVGNRTNVYRGKQITFSITNRIAKEDYLAAIGGALGLFSGICIATLMISLGIFLHTSRRKTTKDTTANTKTNVDGRIYSFQAELSVCSSNSTNPVECNDEVNSTEILVSSNDTENISQAPEEQSNLVGPPIQASFNHEVDSDVFLENPVENDILRTDQILFVSDLSQRDCRMVSKKSNLYFYNLLTIGMFYGPPVIQLVLTYQQFTNNNGDQDICYYNFLCAHPLGTISDFNHVFSNVGYVILGILFMIICKRKQLKIKRRQQNSGEYELFTRDNSTSVTSNTESPHFGIPQHFGMFYALGLALIMEGIMSACYHVCPSQRNFQFDTAFMYTIALLLLLKIHQMRHPDLNANAHKAIGGIAVIIAISVVGVNFGDHSTLFWAVFNLLHLGSCFVISLEVYYLGRFRLNREVFKSCWSVLKNNIHNYQNWHQFIPRDTTTMVLLLIMNCVNWGLSIYGSLRAENFASFLLNILIANVMLYMSYYAIMKIHHKEKISWQPAVYLALSIIIWICAGYFFINKSTTWTLSPAESREFNVECKLFHFYGKWL